MGDRRTDDGGAGGTLPRHLVDDSTDALLTTIRVQELDHAGIIWLIVAVAGFFVGLMPITGPLSWWQSARLAKKYRAASLAPSGPTSAAHIIGILATLLAVVGLFFFASVLLLGFGAVVAMITNLG